MFGQSAAKTQGDIRGTEEQLQEDQNLALELGALEFHLRLQ